MPPPTALNVWATGAPIELSEVCSSVGQLEARVGEGLLWPSFPKKRGKGMLAVIHLFSICVVAAILFVSVDEIEPDRRYALALKFLIVFVSVVAIARRLMP